MYLFKVCSLMEIMDGLVFGDLWVRLVDFEGRVVKKMKGAVKAGTDLHSCNFPKWAFGY